MRYELLQFLQRLAQHCPGKGLIASISLNAIVLLAEARYRRICDTGLALSFHSIAVPRDQMDHQSKLPDFLAIEIEGKCPHGKQGLASL